MADYSKLKAVLDAAYDQSAHGKGRARHANGRDFDRQPILEIGRMVGPGYATGQLMKKAQEAVGMVTRGDHGAAIQELLGTIVYAAAAVVLITEQRDEFDRNTALAASQAAVDRANGGLSARAPATKTEPRNFTEASDRLRESVSRSQPLGSETRGHDGRTQSERLAAFEAEIGEAVSGVRRVPIGTAISFTDGRDGPLS